MRTDVDDEIEGGTILKVFADHGLRAGQGLHPHMLGDHARSELDMTAEEITTGLAYTTRRGWIVIGANGHFELTATGYAAIWPNAH